jgi:small-conductance mechanosensitive channel
MLAPIDFTRIESALATRFGWIELAIVAACFLLGWLFDRRVGIKSASQAGLVRAGVGGVNRLLFPLATLSLLVAAAAAYRHWHPPFFLAIAIPLTIALAVIRVLVYALHGLFGTPAWLTASERAIAFTVWGGVLLYFTGVLPEVGAELDRIKIPIGGKHLSLLDVVQGAAVIVVTIAVTLWLSGLIEQRVQRAAGLDRSVRVVMGKLLRAVLLVIGVLIALQAVGIDLTLLSVFGGALGVGVGLGLQKLASNYIAGFTILLDGSIRLGDMITVDNRSGVVAKVTSRYVVIRGLDGVEAVIPNETLVTTTVLNHSYSNRDVRIAVSVQIGYDCDVDRALALMEAAAEAEPRVQRTPNPPQAFLARFADSGIELELGAWINDPENGQLNLKSALNRRIWQSFREHGIRIPYPQREVRVLADATGERPAPV